MSATFLLIGAGGLVAGAFLVAFVVAVRTGQFDDTTTPALRMLVQDAANTSHTSHGEGHLDDRR